MNPQELTMGKTEPEKQHHGPNRKQRRAYFAQLRAYLKAQKKKAKGVQNGENANKD